MMDEDRLRAITDRCQGSAPLPWASEFEQSQIGTRSYYVRTWLDTPVARFQPVGGENLDHERVIATQEFIAHARSDVPDLLDEIQRQRQRISELEARLIALGGDERRRS